MPILFKTPGLTPSTSGPTGSLSGKTEDLYPPSATFGERWAAVLEKALVRVSAMSLLDAEDKIEATFICSARSILARNLAALTRVMRGLSAHKALSLLDEINKHYELTDAMNYVAKGGTEMPGQDFGFLFDFYMASPEEFINFIKEMTKILQASPPSKERYKPRLDEITLFSSQLRFALPAFFVKAMLIYDKKVPDAAPPSSHFDDIGLFIKAALKHLDDTGRAAMKLALGKCAEKVDRMIDDDQKAALKPLDKKITTFVSKEFTEQLEKILLDEKKEVFKVRLDDLGKRLEGLKELTKYLSDLESADTASATAIPAP